jgi:hypothetical protein
VGFPEFPENLECFEGQRNVSVFVSFTAMDMDEHSLGIDVRYLEMGSFLEPETEGVHGGETSLVMREPYRSEDISDFANTEDHREGFLFFGSDELESGPLSFEGVGEEELDAAQ